MSNLLPLISSFLMIAAAELGDKTQLLTLGFAARFPFWQVIAGVAFASGILMAVAVLFGGIINHFVPVFYAQLFAGLLFIGFGIWTFLGKEKEEEEKEGRFSSPFWIVFTSFLLAELGDKTQLATLTLSAKYGAPFQVWIGATLAMVAINFFSVLAGGWLKTRVPEKWIRIFGALVFIVFGLLTLKNLP